MSIFNGPTRWLIPGWCALFIFTLVLAGLAGCADSRLPAPYTEALSEEFSSDNVGDIDSFQACLQLEDRLFAQLDELVYDSGPVGPEYSLVRYSRSSLAAPSHSERLAQQWPPGIFSLSHVALRFPPDDPLTLQRLRYNPFYDYMEQRVVDWITR